MTCLLFRFFKRASRRPFYHYSFSTHLSEPPAVVKFDVYENDQTSFILRGIQSSPRLRLSIIGELSFKSTIAGADWKFRLRFPALVTYVYFSSTDGFILITGWRARALVAAAWGLSVLFSVPIIFLYEEKRIQVQIYLPKQVYFKLLRRKTNASFFIRKLNRNTSHC